MTRAAIITTIEQLAAVRAQQHALDTAPEVKAAGLLALDEATARYAAMLRALDA